MGGSKADRPKSGPAVPSVGSEPLQPVAPESQQPVAPERPQTATPESPRAATGAELSAVGTEVAGDLALSQKAKDAAAMAQAIGEEPAEKVPTDSEVEGLPENAWTDAYLEMKKNLEENPDLQGPLANGILMVFALAAKYSKYADIFPGKFAKRLGEDPKLKKEKFNEQELEKILAAKKDKQREDAAVRAAQSLPKDTGISRASTAFATMALWGIESGIDDPDTLAARLKNTGKPVGEAHVPYYRGVSLGELSAQGMPYGTVIIFVPDIRTAEKAVAVATGNGDEYQYFDPEKSRIRTFNLRDANSPVRRPMSFLTAFVPQFNSDAGYFEKHGKGLDERVNDTPEIRIERARATMEASRKAIANHKLLAESDGLAPHAEGIKAELARCDQEIMPVLREFLEKPEKVGSAEVAQVLFEIVDLYLSAISDALDVVQEYRFEVGSKGDEAVRDAVTQKEAAKTDEDRKAAVKMETTAREKLERRMREMNDYEERAIADRYDQLAAYETRLKALKAKLERKP